MIEQEETELINKQIAARKSRLGATQKSVTIEVKREVYSQSPLLEIYQNVINWTNNDEIRRKYEEKAFKRAYFWLCVALPAEKKPLREKVLEWAKGMVILKHPFELAWMVYIEWRDVSELGKSTKTCYTNL